MASGTSINSSARVGLALAAMMIALGTAWAFQRGANDFSVFYAAWRLVLDGRGMEVYQATPDRFLYAPAFAWLLSPLGLLPRGLSLAIWCFGKAACIGLVLREFTRKRRGQSGLVWLGVSAWGLVLIARPLLIDFQYGQVNAYIVALCALAVFSRIEGEGSARTSILWVFLAFAAVAKVFPLPLLALPWFVTRGLDAARLRRERLGVAIGLVVALLTPFVFVGPAHGLELYQMWRQALLARGLPLESHNQSFIAFLHHYLSGEPTHVLSEGWPALPFGARVLSPEALELVSLAWTFGALGVLLAWLLRGPRRFRLAWSAVLVGLLIVPSHLIWKPYFVMALPLALVAVHDAFDRGIRSLALIAALFACMNLTGFDFLGHQPAARLEAGALLFFTHLFLLGYCWALEAA